MYYVKERGWMLVGMGMMRGVINEKKENDYKRGMV